MIVLIRTLPLTNANYGGILQNWALQQTLSDLGHEPVTDISERPDSPGLPAVIGYLMRRAVLGVRGCLPARWRLIPGDERRFVDARVLSFVSEQIRTVALFDRLSRTPHATVLKRADAFIVGSDQVWRKDYGDVPSYMLDFLPDSDQRPRIAYAASWGAAEPNEWSEEDLADMRPMLERFSALSVREYQTSEVLLDRIGVHTSVQIDPTLLVSRERYDRLIADAGCRPFTSPYFLVYLLDATPEVLEAVERVAQNRGCHVINIGGLPMGSGAQRHSVPDWLSLFREAQCVVTDSFHGMVFSTIFERRFVVLPNSERGLDRFTSFASWFGLESRLASEVGELGTILSEPIGWPLVGDRIQSARKQGLAFLSEALG